MSVFKDVRSESTHTLAKSHYTDMSGVPLQDDLHSPVDTAWTSLWLDVHVIQVDIHLWDVHLKAVGQQLDGLAHGAIARSARYGEQGRSPNGSCAHTDTYTSVKS